MNVEKQAHVAPPGYPSRRQSSRCQLVVGVAAIGLGAVLGRAGDPPRLGGDLKVEPRDPKPATIKPVATLGLMRADPGATCVATNAPSAVTNQVPPAAASTNNPAQARGRIRVEPK